LWCWFYRLYWQRSPGTDTDSFANPNTDSFADPHTFPNSIAITCIHHYDDNHHHYANIQPCTDASIRRMLFLGCGLRDIHLVLSFTI
jgi:hypothetical protein